MTADEGHCRRLVRALEGSRDIDAVDIQVAVAGGVVTVTGEVGSAAEHLAVRSILVSDRETTRIIDNLQATPLPGEWRLRDDEIAALVAERLGAHPELTEVSPSCDFHIVQLGGVVTDPEFRRTAHHLARTTRGVHFVVDRIETVTPARTVAARAQQ